MQFEIEMWFHLPRAVFAIAAVVSLGCTLHAIRARDRITMDHSVGLVLVWLGVIATASNLAAAAFGQYHSWGRTQLRVGDALGFVWPLIYVALMARRQTDLGRR